MWKPIDINARQEGIDIILKNKKAIFIGIWNEDMKLFLDKKSGNLILGVTDYMLVDFEQGIIDVIDDPKVKPDPIFEAVYHTLTAAKEHGLETEVIATAFRDLIPEGIEDELWAEHVRMSLDFGLNEWIK